MSTITTAVITACAAALVCSILSGFVNDGGMKRILSLILGAFLVASMLIPVRSVFQNIKSEISLEMPKELSATADEAVSSQVIARTRKNLEGTAESLLIQNGINPDRCEIILADRGGGSIIISSIRIYITKSEERTELINSLITQNFGTVPQIITE